MKIPIVVIAYDRGDSLYRLLNSLRHANYDNTEVDLIISIDKNNNKNVYKIAEEFEWNYGKKNIIKHQKNLGLREHVFACGDLAFKYDAVIILEDDLVVSPSFYRYATESVNFYKNEKNIGGISLYNYGISEFANYRTFIPLQDESDVFFMKVPSSWGQIWTTKQWQEFREWYDKKEYNKIDFSGLIPQKALKWGDSSWKKYFYMYIVQHDKYIVYPRVGLSTNMGDSGTHHKANSSEHQSVLMGDFKRSFIFKNLNESECKYDAFFENANIESLFGFGPITVDYYGIKKDFSNASFLLSTRKLNYEVLKEWKLSLKPYELNIFYDEDGDEIFLYDLRGTEKEVKEDNIDYNLIKYELPGITRRKALRVALVDYKEAVKRKFKRILKIK